MIMNYQFTNSSMLSSASYDTETKELTVTFHNGRSYTYEDFDKLSWELLTSAKSAGAYFNSIKKELKVKRDE